MLLGWCRERKLLKVRGKQRTDSTHVLAAVRALNRVELVAESMRAVLNDLAVVAPDWLRAFSPTGWVERYTPRFGHENLPVKEAERAVLVQAIGDDGAALLGAIDDPTSPAWLREIPTVNSLRHVWVQQYVIGETGLRWRTEADGLPPSSHFLSSPYDGDAHLAKKGPTQWVGYKVHLTETCGEDRPELITNVETTPAPMVDGRRPQRFTRASRQRISFPVITSWTPAFLMLNSWSRARKVTRSTWSGRPGRITTGKRERGRGLPRRTSRLTGPSKRQPARPGERVIVGRLRWTAGRPT